MPDVRRAPRTGRTAHAATGRGDAVPHPEFWIRVLDEAFHGPAWHGPSLKSTLRQCTHAEAGRRLAPGRNTVWELVLHAAYGKHLVRARLTNDRRRFPRPLGRSWWPRIVDPTPDGWQQDLALLDASHAALTRSIADATSTQLARRRAGTRHTMSDELMGIVLHDTYHAGQIALVRKLLPA